MIRRDSRGTISVIFEAVFTVAHNCGKCGHEAFISVPLLYHDMDRKFMVQFFPFSLIGERGFLDQFSKEGETLGMEGIPRKIRQLYKTPQIVFDMAELVRYIVFREKLDELWREAS